MKQTLVLIVVLLCSWSVAAQTRVIAHRGYWKCDGSAQNSITALERADEIGSYGSECDLWLTADGVVVVNHDPVIEGINIEKSHSKELKMLRLANGEPMPTFKTYLKAAKKCRTSRLIIEIKTHTTPERNREAVEAVLHDLKKVGMLEQVDFIAFDMGVVQELLRTDATLRVAYLNGDRTPKELKALGVWGMDYHFGLYERNPEWIAQAKELGIAINAWTVNDRAKMEQLVELQVEYITTDQPELLQEVLRESKSE